MSTQAPAQLFDNSHQTSMEQTPNLKTGAEPTIESSESPPPSEIPAFDAQAQEWRDFDWEAYHQRAAKRVTNWDELETRYPALADKDQMALQLWLARQLPAPLIRWILADLPTKSLWEHLGADALKPLKHEALRGFQQAPGSLRREPVQKRLAAWLLQTPDEIHLLLVALGLAISAAASVASRARAKRRSHAQRPLAFADAHFRRSCRRRRARLRGQSRNSSSI